MMNITDFVKNNPVIVAGVIAATVAGLWLATRGAKQTGIDIGSGAVNLAFGAVGGAASAVNDNLLDPAVNPFYDFGSSIGETIFSWTHGEFKP